MLKPKTMGLVFANMHEDGVPELTKNRTLASVPFFGRYRLVDFPLSAMSNVGISEIAVITRSNYLSLMEHLSSGRPWDLDRKQRGLTIFPPYAYESEQHHGRVGQLYSALNYLQRSRAEFVVMSDCNWVCNPDFEHIVNTHAESGFDITMVCTRYEMNPTIARNSITVTAVEDGRVNDIRINYIQPDALISMNIFVVRRDKLIEMVTDAMSRMKVFFERDVLLANLGELKVRCYEHNGYAEPIYDLHSYYRASLELISPEKLDELFVPKRPVCTKVRDDAPVRYGLDSLVTDSVIADGCVIDGEVENCVLFRGVNVKKGAVVKNSVIMQDSVIDEQAQVNYVVGDKNIHVNSGITLNGVSNYPMFIDKNSVI